MVDSETEENRVRRLLVDTGDAFQRKDVDAFIKCFHRDVLALYPNTPIMRGLKPWSKFIEEAVRDNVSVKYDEIIVKISESGNHGYGVGIFSGFNRTSEGQIGFTSRLLASVWKIDGEWKIVAISYNR